MGYANGYQTTTTGSLTAGATSVAVASTTGIPAVPFTATIAAEGANTDEIVMVTANAAGTLTLVRAYENFAGVGASAHASGATIAATVTANDLRTERALVDPSLQTWSWVNQGSATITAFGASLVLHDPANASDSWRMRVMTSPSKPYTVYAHVKGVVTDNGNPGFMVGWLESTGNTFAGFSQYWSGASVNLASSKSGTNFLITVNYQNWTSQTFYPWVALCDDTTNRRIWISQDGNDWVLFHSVATNDFLTPNRFFLGVESRNSSSLDASITIDTWEQTGSSTP